MVRPARTSPFAVVAGTVAVLVACGTAGATPEIHHGNALPLPAGALTARDVADAQTAFGVDLLHAVCEQAPGQNVLLSPASAAEALGLLYPAAGGATAGAFGALMHLPAWSPDLVAAMREHTRALDGLRYDGDLTTRTPPTPCR